jgi:CP family cyanate transporter-like MFS transporter
VFRTQSGCCLTALMTLTHEPPDTASTPTGAARSRRSGAFFGAYVAAGLVVVAFNLRIGVVSVGPVLSSIQSGLGVSSSTASLLTTIPVFAFGAFAFLTPALTRRVGLHRLLGITMAVLTVGIAVRLIPSPLALFAGTVLVGAAIAVANVGMPAVIKQDFSHRVGLMMSLYTTSLFIGAAVAAAFTVPLMVAFDGSWRAALGFWALPAVVALLIWLPRVVRGIGRGSTATSVSGSRATEREEPRLGRLLRDPVAWAVTTFMGLQSLGYYAAMTWVPSILQDAGISAHDAGLMLSFSSFPGIAAALIVPVVIRWLRPPWLPVALSTVLCAVGFAGLLVAPASLPLLWMTLLGFGQGAAISLSLTFIVLRSPDARHTAHVSTMAQGLGYLLAGFGPLGFGALHSVTGGWTAPIAALLVLLVAQFLTGAAASRERHVLSGQN